MSELASEQPLPKAEKLARIHKALTGLLGADVAEKLYGRARVKHLKETRSEISKRACRVICGVLAGDSFSRAARNAGYSETYVRKRPQRIWQTIRNVFWEHITGERERQIAHAINVLFDAIASMEPPDNTPDEPPASEE